MPVVSFGRTGKRMDFRTLDVRADDTDARDYIFEPSLALLPSERYPLRGVPVLDQGQEGACVGFALATVINVSMMRRAALSERRRRAGRTFDQVSARMLYEIAKRYDEWQGEHYDGTSPRGAMKGWHHHGVASERTWTSKGKLVKGTWRTDRAFTIARADDAKQRPIGTYYRLIDSDVRNMQAAIVEGDAVLASAWVHEGWDLKNAKSRRGRLYPAIPYQPRGRGLHAFAIVGYTPDGFIIQNSWGRTWGHNGLALLHYDDWMEHRQDAWVARPGPETRDHSGKAKIFTDGFGGSSAPDEKSARVRSTGDGLNLTNPELLSYLINTGDRGELSKSGALTTDPNELPAMARKVLASPVLSDGYHHVVLYAHGGLTSELSAVAVADRLWGASRTKGFCPYFFIWESGWSDSLFGRLKSDDDQTGPAGSWFGDLFKKIGGKIEQAVREAQKAVGRSVAGKVRDLFWDEMKGRCAGASQPNGGAARFVKELVRVMSEAPAEQYKIHLVGHSAGSIYHGFLYEQQLRGPLPANVEVSSVHFLAPAITMERARQAFAGGPVPAKHVLVHNLSHADEEVDSIWAYPSSLLTYVADCLESSTGRRVPVLGLERDWNATTHSYATMRLATRSRKHGDFDDVGYEIEQVWDAIGKPSF